jgi:von Willebrand factor type A domain/Aerotolerance regulator N-terminal
MPWDFVRSLEFSSPLGPARWLALAAVPAGIVALYFLKLRRRPVQVSSTLLWRKSLEDLHVNSLFQRLRRNLLLFLQLLIIALAMLALAGPRMKGSGGQMQRYVLMIDNSASMSATDVPPSRLEKAREEARKIIRNMGSDDLAMVVSFADSARVVSNYTSDKRLLLRRIDAIQPTQGSTSLREALQVAAGLANPSKQFGEGVVASAQVAPKLFIYTDGGFPDVEGFSLGNLEPEVVVIGPPPPPYTPPGEGSSEADAKADVSNPSDNVAVVALQSRTSDDKPDVYQLFGRVHNFRDEPVKTEAQLFRRSIDKPGEEGTLVDALALEIPARTDQSFKFDIPETQLTEYEVRLPVEDALAVDNRAFAVVGNARKAQVLVVSAGDRYLVDAFNTPTAVDRADVVVVSPEEAKGEAVAREIKGGRYDLVIYDGWRPETAPEANALYFGVFPPGEAYDKVKEVESPVILDWNIGHPMMQYIRDLSLVYVAKGRIVEPPAGATTLIESNLGPLAFVVPREGFTDAVVGFPLLDGTNPNTTWFRYISFPLFLFNCVEALGNVRSAEGELAASPGKPVPLRAETAEKSIQVTSADGSKTETVERTPQGTFVYNQAETTGLYAARWGKDSVLPFAVNLFDFRESDLAPRGLVPAGAPESLAESYKIKIGYNPVAGVQGLPETKLDWWKHLAVAGLAVLLIEWYIYNKRVYI